MRGILVLGLLLAACAAVRAQTIHSDFDECFLGGESGFAAPWICLGFRPASPTLRESCHLA